MSSAVVQRPIDTRREPNASASDNPTAFKTCDGVSDPDVQADPMIDAAFGVIDVGMDIYPREKELYLLKGVILANNNRVEDAISIWQEGAAIAPDDARFSDNIRQARMLLSR